jgi:hypothetical protein
MTEGKNLDAIQKESDHAYAYLRMAFPQYDELDLLALCHGLTAVASAKVVNKASSMGREIDGFGTVLALNNSQFGVAVSIATSCLGQDEASTLISSITGGPVVFKDPQGGE